MAGTNANTRGLGAETIPLVPRLICAPRELGDAEPWHAETKIAK